MRAVLIPFVVLVAGCTQSPLLDIDSTQPGITGARATGQYPDIQAVPGRATRQLDAGTYADIRTELNADAERAARRAPVDGTSADARARRLVAQAEAEERRRRKRIRDRNRVAPASVPLDVVFNREDDAG